VGTLLVGADLVQPTLDEGPANAPDREPDFADGYDVADRQFPGKFSRVAEPSRGDWLLHSCGVSCHSLTSVWLGTVCDHRWMLDSVTAVKPDTRGQLGTETGTS
jgi:hypothetical protein